MKKSIIFCLALALSFGFLSAQPKIEVVGGDTYDWGVVSSKNDPLKAKIEVKNVGDQVLTITEVRASCGCTSTNLGKSDLKPGESTFLDVTLRTSGHVNNLHKTIRVGSNDPANSSKIIHIKANVVALLQLTPTPYFTYQDMQVGKSSVGKLKLKNNCNIPITISDAEVQPKNIEFSVKNKITLQPNEEIELSTTVIPEITGQYNCSIVVKTDHPDFPTLRIDGFGRVKESPVYNNK